MKGLKLLLMQNYSLLDKHRARLRYCRASLNSVESDTHKLYGPFSGFWDEWAIEAGELHSLIEEHVTTTALFLEELRDFIKGLEAKTKLSKSDISYLREVTSLTTDKLIEQKDLLFEIDERIFLHKQVTKQILMVEAIDSLEE